ncbi:hypothetical protein Ndes2526B_g09031 [Nannochloris sp. 'desiccata']|nr:hypothetical protein KSW81_001416 [Chlorella desiccata (nom. nud.)]KAH7616925.1 hypothetical protein NADE_001728 [Chlorella desiccata (nom. nud.)]
MASLICTITLVAFFLMASPVLGAQTVTTSIKNKKVRFSGFGEGRKYTIKKGNNSKGYQTKSTITVCAGDSVKFNWDEQEAMDKYQEFNRFSNPVSAAALADCPQLWNSQVSEEEKGSKTYKQSSPVTKYFATARRYRGGRWQCEASWIVNWEKC